MSQFLSPAFRVFRGENSDSIIQRKPGTVNQLSNRKPFLDKTVNCKTPNETNKKQQLKVTVKDNVKLSSPSVKAGLEIPVADLFSFKHVEEVDDILPFSQKFNQHDFYNVLKNYVRPDTPPMSFLNGSVEESNTSDEEVMYETSIDSDNSFDDDVFFSRVRSSIFDLGDHDEVDLPDFTM